MRGAHGKQLRTKKQNAKAAAKARKKKKILLLTSLRVTFRILLLTWLPECFETSQEQKLTSVIFSKMFLILLQQELPAVTSTEKICFALSKPLLTSKEPLVTYATNYHFLSQNSQTNDPKRHVKTVPVRLETQENYLGKAHPDKNEESRRPKVNG